MRSRKGGPQKNPGPRDKYGRLIVDLKPDESLSAILEHRSKYHSGFATGVVVDQVHPNDKAVFRTVIKRNFSECALDRLKLAGVLGYGDDAEIRYRTGEWLRKLYVEAHPGRDTLNALVRSGNHPSSVGDMGSWSESRVSDVFYIGRVLAGLGRHGNAVEAVCCHDQVDVRISELRAGLDMLADNHGIRRAYEDEQAAQRQRDHHQPEQRAP